MADTPGTFPNLQSPLIDLQRGTVTTAWYRLFLKLQAQIQAGSVIQWAGGGTPSGTLLCNGAAISRSTYSALFSVIGITFGPGDGSTTFNLPNLPGIGTGGNVKYFIYY